MRWAVGFRVFFLIWACSIFSSYGQTDSTGKRLILIISGEPQLQSKLRSHHVKNIYESPQFEYTSLKEREEFNFGFGLALPLNQWIKSKRFYPLVGYNMTPMFSKTLGLIDLENNLSFSADTKGINHYLYGGLGWIPFGYKTITIGLKVSGGWHQINLTTQALDETNKYTSNQFGYDVGLGIFYTAKTPETTPLPPLYLPVTIGFRGTDQINYAYVEVIFSLGFFGKN